MATYGDHTHAYGTPKVLPHSYTAILGGHNVGLGVTIRYFWGLELDIFGY